MNKKRRGRGEGSIHRRGKLWVGSVTVGYYGNGNPKRKVVYGKTKDEAKNKLLQLHQKAATGKLEIGNLTVEAFLQEWLENVIKGRLDEGTEHLYRQRVEDHIFPFIGCVKVSKLNEKHVENLLSDLSAKGKTADLRKKVLELLRRALKHAIQRKYTHENVAKNVLSPRVQIEEIHPLNQGQVQAFLSVAKKNRLYPLFLLAFDSGMRQGEIIALLWTDINLDAGTVSVTKTAKTGNKGSVRIKEAKTRASMRTVKLSRPTLEALRRWRAKSGGRIVFPARVSGIRARTGESYLLKGSLHRSFKRLLKNASLPDIRFHDLRHTHATLALLKTKNIKAVSARLGHKDIQVTLNTYAHVLPEMETEIVDAMEGLLAPAA